MRKSLVSEVSSISNGLKVGAKSTATHVVVVCTRQLLLAPLTKDYRLSRRVISCFIQFTPCKRTPVFYPKVRIWAVFIATLATATIVCLVPPRTKNFAELGIV